MSFGLLFWRGTRGTVLRSPRTAGGDCEHGVLLAQGGLTATVGALQCACCGTTLDVGWVRAVPVDTGLRGMVAKEQVRHWSPAPGEKSRGPGW